MRTLDDINNEVLALIGLVPDASNQTEQLGNLGDIEVAYSSAIGHGVLLPAGDKLIAVFNTTCPTGWTRVVAWDDKFIRGAATYGGTGGSSGTHTHSYSGVIAHTHGAGTLNLGSDGSHDHSYTVVTTIASTTAGAGVSDIIGSVSTTTTGSGGSHDHSLTGNTTSAGDASATSGTNTMLPPYIEVVFCSRN